MNNPFRRSGRPVGAHRDNRFKRRRIAALHWVLPLWLLSAVVGLGGSHPAALAAGSPGSVYAWGDNRFDQVGTTTNHATPQAIALPNGVTATAVAMGGNFSLALGSDSRVYAWGYNSWGQLGDGSTTESLTPVAVSLPPDVKVTAIAAGETHGMAQSSDGTLYAWGHNSEGQLGSTSVSVGLADSFTDVPVVVNLPANVRATAIAAGYLHSLAIGSDNVIYGWGSDSYGELGNGSAPVWETTPVPVSMPKGVIPAKIAAGQSHSLAIDTNGNLYAWGINTDGELGTGSATVCNLCFSDIPVSVSLASGVKATAIAGGYSHSLAIGSDNHIYGWGANDQGQVGNGSNTFRFESPMLVTLPGGVTPKAVGAGYDQSLAIGSDGKVYTWGGNEWGQLGNSTVGMCFGCSRTSPILTDPIAGYATAIGTGPNGYHSLAIIAGTASQTDVSNGTQAQASVGGAGPNTPGSYTATASGASGSVTVGTYSDNPTGANPPPNGSNYFDVKVSAGNSFTSVSIVDCNLGAATTLYWFDGTTWRVASPQSANTPTAGCVTLTVTSSSSPTLSQLTGTPFAAGSAGAPTAARVSAAHASRHAGVLTLSWRLLHSRTVVGFNLYAGALRLNAHLIPVHRAASYAFHTHWSGAGPYTLHVLLSNGRSINLPIQ